jgi:hypothetical protein
VRRVGGDPAQGPGSGLEQNVLDDRLVPEGDHGDLVRHGEHDVEVGYVEQFCLPVRQPSGASQ